MTDDRIQEYDSPGIGLERGDYDTAELKERHADLDIRDGVRLDRETIAAFADGYEDDQVLHTGDQEALRAYDDEYSASTVFDELETIDTRVVPGAQLLSLSMDALDAVERIESLDFERPVMEGETVRLRHTGSEDDLDSYVLEKLVEDSYEPTGELTVEHGQDNGAVFGSLLPIGMGVWDREGDVLLGYQDVTADKGFDPDDALTFTREALDGKDTPVGRIQQYRNTFMDEDGDAVTYQVSNLHL